MKFKKAILMLLFLVLAGCMGKYVENEKVRDQINVFGVALFSSVDYKEINGVSATEEPCLKGYDRSYDALDITVGYGFNKRIRKIITRNPTTSLFGVSPGMSFGEGRQKILGAGFIEAGSSYKFKADGFSLTLLVDGSQKIFGIAVELLD
ncbi:MAG: hypothetical protein C0392_07885 [Syntrophus sp. (in: bacteria)]|nr:hypothetical protein [Syntrophus sp. (in: bacteria)]